MCIHTCIVSSSWDTLSECVVKIGDVKLNPYLHVLMNNGFISQVLYPVFGGFLNLFMYNVKH